MGTSSILIISGTNRLDSNAMKISRLIQANYAKIGANAEIFSLTELPREIFEGTAYATKPPEMVVIQQRVLDAGGLHIVTPEYNGSFPGILKYFIDMLKFPESFEGKPVAFTGEAAGIWGALRSVEQLQAIFGYRNAHIFPDRVFIPGINQKLNSDGALTDSDIAARLQKQAEAFAKFIARVKS
jgi:NAD(P)H-dependent FMN reductase